MDDSSPHLQDLATRLARVEQRLDNLQSTTTPPPSPAPDTLWALQGLQDRAADPAGAVLLTGAVTTPKGMEACWQMQSDARDLFDSDFADRADSLAALAQPVRLRLIQRILTDVSTVNDLLGTGEFGTSGQVYHHLRQLVSAGWLQTTGKSRYEVPASRVVPLLVILLGVDR